MAKGRGEVKFKDSVAFVDNGSATGSKVKTLSEALAQNTLCGCGIECECFGYLKIRNFNSVTGKYDYRVMYFVDGVAKFDTQKNAELEIQSYKDIAGGLIPA